MGSKKCGDLNSMVFQGIADAQKFILFCVLMEIVDAGAGIKVVVFDL